jgi:heat shock protein HspQ
MKPVVNSLSTTYNNQIDFVYLDIDDPNNNEAKEKYGYRYQPHFFIVNEKEEVQQEWVGYVTEETFTAALDDFLSKQ